MKEVALAISIIFLIMILTYTIIPQSRCSQEDEVCS